MGGGSGSRQCLGGDVRQDGTECQTKVPDPAIATLFVRAAQCSVDNSGKGVSCCLICFIGKLPLVTL